jgi:hypothetical protein
MAQGLQGAVAPVHLLPDGMGVVTVCGLGTTKAMRRTRVLWDVTCDRCLAAESERLDLAGESTEGR